MLRRPKTPVKSYKTTAIVLRGRLFGEADRIVTLLRREYGKGNAIAKGARRTKSHLAGRLEFGNEVFLTMHRGRTLDVVVSAQNTGGSWAQLVQPHRYAAATRAAELVDTFCEPDLPVPEIYDLLSGALRAFSRSEDPLALMPRFNLRLLDALGLAPPPDRCIMCARPLSENAWLLAEQGGLACESCGAHRHDGAELHGGDLRNLLALGATAGGQIAPTVHATPAVAAAVDDLIAHHLGRRPKAGAAAAELSAS